MNVFARLNSLIKLGLIGLSILACSSMFGQKNTTPEEGLRGAQRIKTETRKELPAGRRLALLIANSNYDGEAQLNTPRADIDVVGSRLKKLGFGITIKYDLDRKQLRKAVAKFTEDLTLNDEVYFHYAGHGLELDDGEPMLLGVDFVAYEAEDAKIQGYKVSSIVSSFSGVGRAVVIVDACRNNPFTKTRSLSRSLSQSSEASRGLPSS